MTTPRTSHFRKYPAWRSLAEVCARIRSRFIRRRTPSWFADAFQDRVERLPDVHPPEAGWIESGVEQESITEREEDRREGIRRYRRELAR